MNHKRQSASSLIETIVVIAILSVIAVIGIGYIADTARLYSTVLAEESADSDALDTFRRMRNEVRSLQMCTNADSGTFSFVNVGGVTNTFRLDGNLVTLNGYVMARDVTAFALSYYNSTNGVLTPTNDAGRQRIRRVGIRLTINRNGQPSDWNGNIFYASAGTLR